MHPIIASLLLLICGSQYLQFTTLTAVIITGSVELDLRNWSHFSVCHEVQYIPWHGSHDAEVLCCAVSVCFGYEAVETCCFIIYFFWSLT